MTRCLLRNCNKHRPYAPQLHRTLSTALWESAARRTAHPFEQGERLAPPHGDQKRVFIFVFVVGRAPANAPHREAHAADERSANNATLLLSLLQAHISTSNTSTTTIARCFTL